MKTLKISHIERTLLLLMCISIFIFNYQATGNGNVITNILILAFIFLEIILVIGKCKVLKNYEIFSFVLFLVCCFISCIYSFNESDSLIKVKTILILVLLLFALVEFLKKDEKNFNFLLKTLAFSGSIASLYLIINADWKSGVRIDNIIGDSNQVGAYIAYSFTVLLFLVKTKNVNKVLGISGLVVMFIANMLSGSRSALIVTVLSLIVFWFISIKPDKKMVLKIIFSLILGVILLYLLYYFIMNNEVLYNIIGKRYVSFFEIISGEQSSINETSTQTRSMLIDLAWNKFIYSPFTILFGNGIGYFASYWESIGGRYAFCHNNYLELLSGVGIIGTIFFYFTYVKTLLICIKKIKKDRDLKSIMCMIILMQMLIMHWFVVFYYQKCEFLFISIFVYFNYHILKKKKTEKIDDIGMKYN